MSTQPPLVRASSDAQDQLVEADEPLVTLQLRCGGEFPGIIAVPALLEAVRKARRHRLSIGRAIAAQDGDHAVSAWAEIRPRGDDGCEIVLRNWRVTALPPDDPAEMARRHNEIDRHLAELTARLDASQRLLVADADAADLAGVLAAMRAGVGRPWTDFVTIEGSSHSQPLHWRLLDGAAIVLAGSNRSWRATLLPQAGPDGDPVGFELLLTAKEPPASPPTVAPVVEDDVPPAREFGVIGREIAPVLRQPIARIIANAETIRTRLAGPLPDEYAGYAADIAAAGEHLLGIVEDLSDLEVVEAADFVTSPDHIDLAEVARKAAGILGMRASERKIVVDVPPASVSLPAIAEFRRVLQIMLNLIGNAIRYSPEGSRVRVLLDGGSPRVRAIIADEGAGLSSEDQTRVFEKFERLGRSGDGGTGLGLYISRRLARAMGGDLTVESTIGQGARFILNLPAGDAVRQPAGVVSGPRLPRIPAQRSASPRDPDQG